MWSHRRSEMRQRDKRNSIGAVADAVNIIKAIAAASVFQLLSPANHSEYGGHTAEAIQAQMLVQHLC